MSKSPNSGKGVNNIRTLATSTRSCYFIHGGDMLKRVADWLEKISAGSMLIGLYQGNNYAVLFGFFLIIVALYLEWRIKQ
jgi:hypothetical protein